MVKLKDIKVESNKKQVKIPCEICGKELKELSSIRWSTTDTSHRYVGSKRPFIMNYKVKVCPRCFKKTVKGMDKLLEMLSDENN